MLLRIGETFAGYRVLRLLGSGGMGEVYLVQHPRLPRQEALKVLRADLSSDESFRERFIREADLAAGLRHPNIVGVHDRGEHDGHLWIAMDHIDGTDAVHLLERKYPAGMPADLVAHIIGSVASALDHAHKKGLLHRDVKPANIIIADEDGVASEVYLADFGIARPLDDTSGITTTNMTVGTVAYAAPEQLMGEPLDGRADQYALAATAYHLLTGLQLFRNSNPAVVISHHLNSPAPPLADTRPGLEPLDPVLAAALAKGREDRFRCCTDFAHALNEVANRRSGGISAAPTTPAQVARKRKVSPELDDAALDLAEASLRLPWRLMAVTFCATVLVLGVIVALWSPWSRWSSTTVATLPPTAPSATIQTGKATPPKLATSGQAPVTTTATPKVVRTPTVYSPGDEIPHIEGADWDGYTAAMDKGLSPEGIQKMFGITWTDSAAWVCGWVAEGADQPIVENRLVNKYSGLSYRDAGVIYRSAMDWVCPASAPAPVSPPTAQSNPNGPGCSTHRPDLCGQWTPEQAEFACRATMAGADYTSDLKRTLMNRYGLDETSAFFLGKEAMYSINSGGAYIPPPSNAEGFHPLCNDFAP